MEEKVRKLLERFEEVELELAKPEVLSDQKRYKALSQEHSQLSELKEVWHAYEAAKKSLADNRGLLQTETDPELVEMLQDESAHLEEQIPALQAKVEALLVPPDPRDSYNVIMELRAGTGGDEAAIFVGDCVRMYKLYADKMGWQYEAIEASPSEAGGFKEYIMAITGKNVYRFLQYEAGTHRVQRVPVTETQGRVHTSAITVAVLFEPPEEEQVKIDPKDLKIDTFRASGAGGQHVNVTDSAVRITHIPTGLVVACQDGRSQHKNREKAMRVLSARLADAKKQKEQEERATLRASQVGSGDRSERIRTYNFSQNRMTDHRINMTLYKLSEVMEGDLDELLTALVSHFYQEKLRS